MQIIKNELSRIKLFMGNVWMILAVDPLRKVIFSFLCASFSLLIAEGMLDVIGRVAVNIGGIRYIDKTNMIPVAKSPLAAILFLLFLIIMTFCALFEIGGLLHSFSMAQVGRKTDMWSMVVAGARTCRKTFRPQNWSVLLFVMILFPVTGLISLSNAAYKVEIPLYIELAIDARPLFKTTFIILYLIMVIVEIAVLFSINIYVLREKNFWESCKGAWKLGKSRILNTVICVLFLSLAVNYLISWFSTRILGDSTGAEALSHIIRAMIVPSVNNAGITALFYQYYEEDRSLATIDSYVFRTEEISHNKKVVAAGCTVLIFASGLFYAAIHNNYLWQVLLSSRSCCHRNSADVISKLYPPGRLVERKNTQL